MVACLHATTALISAGSFALPWAFERLGLLLGLLAVVTAGCLSRCALADLICVKGSTGCGACGLPRRRKRGHREDAAATAARGATLPPPGLAELAAEVLGHPAGCLTRLVLVLRDVVVVAAHTALAAGSLQLLVEGSAVCSAGQPDSVLIAGGPQWLHVQEVCGFHPWAWSALVLLAALCLTFLGPKCLACLYVVGVAALAAVAAAIVTVGALVRPQALRMESLLQPPLSLEAVAESLGVVTFLYCSHFRVLPPLLDGMKRQRHFGCVASCSFGAAALANIAIGLAGGPLLDAAMGKDEHLPEEFLPAAHYVRWLLCGGNMALCPAMLSPAVEQIRRAMPRCPSWMVCLILLGLAAAVSQLGSLGQIVNFGGGNLHCLVALVLPPALAIWALPWQSSAQTALRVILIFVGIAIAVGSTHAAAQTLEHALPSSVLTRVPSPSLPPRS